MRETIDKEKLNDVADVLERMVEAMREAAAGESAFTRACENRGLNWNSCRGLILTKTFERCTVPPTTGLEDVIGIAPDPYERLYMAVFPEIELGKVKLPFDYRESVIAALDTLTARERDITCKRCGIDESFTCLTLDEIAKEYKLTRERIHQIYNLALHKLGTAPARNLLLRGLCQTLADREVEEAEKEATRNAVRKRKEEIIRAAQKRAEEKAEEIDAKTMEISIEDLNLSVRSYNCLKRANIQTLGELLDLSDDQLMQIKNLGWRSLEEIKARKAQTMKKIGLC